MKKMTQIFIRLPEELKKILEAEADNRGLSVNALMIFMIEKQYYKLK